MRYVLGINDDYISPGFTSDNIGEAVDEGRGMMEDHDVWKVDIEARSDEVDATLLVMVLWERNTNE